MRDAGHASSARTYVRRAGLAVVWCVASSSHRGLQWVNSTESSVASSFISPTHTHTHTIPPILPCNLQPRAWAWLCRFLGSGLGARTEFTPVTAERRQRARERMAFCSLTTNWVHGETTTLTTVTVTRRMLLLIWEGARLYFICFCVEIVMYVW